jgi:hypothetical protein
MLPYYGPWMREPIDDDFDLSRSCTTGQFVRWSRSALLAAGRLPPRFGAHSMRRGSAAELAPRAGWQRPPPSPAALVSLFVRPVRPSVGPRDALCCGNASRRAEHRAARANRGTRGAASTRLGLIKLAERLPPRAATLPVTDYRQESKPAYLTRNPFAHIWRSVSSLCTCHRSCAGLFAAFAIIQTPAPAAASPQPPGEQCSRRALTPLGRLLARVLLCSLSFEASPDSLPADRRQRARSGATSGRPARPGPASRRLSRSPLAPERTLNVLHRRRWGRTHVLCAQPKRQGAAIDG